MRVLLIPLALLLLVGCSGTKVTSKASSQSGKYRVRTIALIPFETIATPQAIEASGPAFPVPSGARRSDMAVGVPPTTDQSVRQTHRVPASAGEKITDLMWTKLKARSGLQLLSPHESARVAREIPAGTATDPLPAHKIAQRLGADAALTGKVLVYQERVGSRLGADPPAAVGFEVKLVAPENFYFVSKAEPPMQAKIRNWMGLAMNFWTRTGALEKNLIFCPEATGPEGKGPSV